MTFYANLMIFTASLMIYLVFEAGSIVNLFDTVLTWTGLAASAILKRLAEFWSETSCQHISQQ